MEFFLFSVTAIWVFSCCIKGQTAQTFLQCSSPKECKVGEQCCGDVCRKWRDCSGVCDTDKDCDEINGEDCVKRLCECKRSPCNEVVFPVPSSCKTAADCQKDEICNEHYLCVKDNLNLSDGLADSNPLNWRTVLILVLSILVAVILIAVFIRCTFHARAERSRAWCSRNSRQDSFFASVRWRRNMASCAHNGYNYESAATNITIDLNEDNTRTPNSDTPPEYTSATERPGTPPPSYEEAVIDSSSRSVISCANTETRETYGTS